VSEAFSFGDRSAVLMVILSTPISLLDVIFSHSASRDHQQRATDIYV